MHKYITSLVVVAVLGLIVRGEDVSTTLLKAPNARDLEAFFDGAIRVQMETKHIAGAVVAVVANNQVVFTKGYGYADVAARKPVDPQKTLFRIASISKPFTWTAVMQQVEAGKLDLNTDVNRYMKGVEIPATFAQPITLKHLLTHTPGFEDNVIGLFGREPDPRSLREILQAKMPARVRPPGTLASYSNHGTGLAGYVVECVANQPWEDYIEQKLLKPLKMENTVVRQPAKDQLPAGLSKGYKWKGGQFVAQEHEYCNPGPAGCISTTAADMTRFMMAHLNDGQLDGAQILKPETARLMREPLFRHDAKVSPMCYGFFEETHNGQRLVGHGGDLISFHSLMQLIPAKGVGLFVSYNTDTSGGVRDQMLTAFMDRYYPQQLPARAKAAAGFQERAPKLAGEFGNTRYSHTTLAKLAALLNVSTVTINADETITISNGENSRRYVEKEPYLFREVDGTREALFQQDEQGNVVNLFFGNAPPSSAVRRKWYELSTVQWGLLAVCVGIQLTALLLWPAIGWTVRGLSSPAIQRSRFSAVLSSLAWLMCLLSVIFVVGLMVVLADPSEIAFGMPPVLQGLLMLTQVIAILAALSLVGCILAWWNRYWRVSGRVHYTLVALAGVGTVWFLYFWNLLTWGVA